MATPAITSAGLGLKDAMLPAKVTVMSPWVLGARWSSTVAMRAPTPKLGLSIMR